MRRRAGWRRFSTEPLEVGQPDLDERADSLLEARFARDGERLLVALPGLAGIDSLLQPVVPGDEKSLNALTGIVALHIRTVAVHISTQK